MQLYFSQTSILFSFVILSCLSRIDLIFTKLRLLRSRLLDISKGKKGERIALALALALAFVSSENSENSGCTAVPFRERAPNICPPKFTPSGRTLCFPTLLPEKVREKRRGISPSFYSVEYLRIHELTRARARMLDMLITYLSKSSAVSTNCKSQEA